MIESLAPVELEAHPVDGTGHPVVGLEMGPEIPDLEKFSHVSERFE
jgi:hypothetical protein